MNAMKYTLNNFFYIGGNCADIGFMGKNRIKGPVDNMIGINGLYSVKSLFENTLLDEFNETPKIINWKKTIETDPGISHIYKNYQVVHNIPTTEKFKTMLALRYNNFVNFYNKAKTDKKLYFIYHINEYDMSKKNKTVNENFYKGIEYIKTLDIIDNIIITQTVNVILNNAWQYNHVDITKCCEENNIKHIIIKDNTLYSKNPTKIVNNFLNTINIYLNEYENGSMCNCQNGHKKRKIMQTNY